MATCQLGCRTSFTISAKRFSRAPMTVLTAAVSSASMHLDCGTYVPHSGNQDSKSWFFDPSRLYHTVGELCVCGAHSMPDTHFQTRSLNTACNITQQTLGKWPACVPPRPQGRLRAAAAAFLHQPRASRSPDLQEGKSLAWWQDHAIRTMIIRAGPAMKGDVLMVLPR